MLSAGCMLLIHRPTESKIIIPLFPSPGKALSALQSGYTEIEQVCLFLPGNGRHAFEGQPAILGIDSHQVPFTKVTL